MIMESPQSYSSFSEVAERMNASGADYIVLRNFENLLTPEVFQDGHGDIDILCNNPKRLVDVLKAKPFNHALDRSYGDGVHYYILIKDEKVSLDIRSVGDGYYCEQWQKDMLATRVPYNGFYVPDDVNLFYSLTYHAILQKRRLSDEYAARLSGMADNLHIKLPGCKEKDFIEVLNIFMHKKGYRYCYSTDIYVPLRRRLVDGSLLQINAVLIWKHFLFDSKVSLIECLVKLKHFLEWKRT